MADMTWHEAILRVLGEASGPVHYADIAQAIIDKGYRQKVGATPAATVAANLSSPQMKGSVERVKMGVYRLVPQPGAHAQGSEAAMSPPLAAEPEVQDIVEEMGLINAFGMFWRRSEVHWSSQNPPLLGAQQSGSEPVDFATQAGVYLLYDGNRVVYVGRVTETRLGKRLRDHTRDRLTGRWDRFSWFGVRRTSEGGSLGPVPTSGIAVATLIATMEALLIEGLEPPQNRRQGDGFNALEFIQVTDPEVERNADKPCSRRR